MTDKQSRTLTIHFDNYAFLADIKLDMQKIAKGSKRIDFDDALAYLKKTYKAEQLEQFVKVLIK